MELGVLWERSAEVKFQWKTDLKKTADFGRQKIWKAHQMARTFGVLFFDTSLNASTNPSVWFYFLRSRSITLHLNASIVFSRVATLGFARPSMRESLSQPLSIIVKIPIEKLDGRKVTGSGTNLAQTKTHCNPSFLTPHA